MYPFVIMSAHDIRAAIGDTLSKMAGVAMEHSFKSGDWNGRIVYNPRTHRVFVNIEMRNSACRNEDLEFTGTCMFVLFDSLVSDGHVIWQRLCIFICNPLGISLDNGVDLHTPSLVLAGVEPLWILKVRDNTLTQKLFQEPVHTKALQILLRQVNDWLMDTHCRYGE